MTFKLIKPPPCVMANGHFVTRPSLYRACVSGNRKEYDECEKKIIASYNKANKREGYYE